MQKKKRDNRVPNTMSSKAVENSDNMWHKDPDLIRCFLEKKSDYEQLCTEVGYILTKRLKDYGVEVSTVIWRSKTLNSFLEKIQRKEYDSPFDDIKDFAGIRVIYLYKKDEDKVEKVIYSEFDVEEKINKLEEKDADRFGYLAMHYIARLSSKSSGARYEHLKNLSFEIQVRTVLQDAWAIIDHHLAYKKESNIPKHLQRSLMRIAGMFELVDEEFSRIQYSIQDYVTDLQEASQNDVEQFLKSELDLNSFLEYLSWRFKDVPREKFEDQGEMIFEGINLNKYPNLFHLNEAIKNTDSLRMQIEEILHSQDSKTYNYATSQFFISLGIVDKEFRRSRGFPKYIVKVIEKFDEVVPVKTAEDQIKMTSKDGY